MNVYHKWLFSSSRVTYIQWGSDNKLIVDYLADSVLSKSIIPTCFKYSLLVTVSKLCVFMKCFLTCNIDGSRPTYPYLSYAVFVKSIDMTCFLAEGKFRKNKTSDSPSRQIVNQHWAVSFLLFIICFSFLFLILMLIFIDLLFCVHYIVWNTVDLCTV